MITHASLVYQRSVSRKDFTMIDIIAKETIHLRETTYLFQGEEHGEVPVSFFWLHTLPGRGPVLHLHPYKEIFVMQQGQATFTIGDETLEVHGGQIVVAPANTPHKFRNSGAEPLLMISIHLNKCVIQQKLEE
jgi:mannose-6-phosphate isomerase-like protein (cupin superfamily)